MWDLVHFERKHGEAYETDAHLERDYGGTWFRYWREEEKTYPSWLENLVDNKQPKQKENIKTRNKIKLKEK